MRGNRWIGPVVLIVLLIATGLLTVVLPSIRSATVPSGETAAAPPLALEPVEEAEFEEVTIDVDGYLLGEELVKIPGLDEYSDLPQEERTYSSPFLLGVITAIVVGSLALFTVPIALVSVFSARMVNSMEASENYQAASSNLEAAATQYVKERKAEQPPGDIPDHNRTGWSAWSTGMVAVILAYFGGYVLGEGISVGLGSTLGTVFALAAAVLSFLLLRPKTIVDVDESEYNPPNWSLLWVLLSGGLMMGLGVGLMFIVINGGNPFPFITWDPAPSIDWTYFQELIEPLTNWS